MLKSKMSHFSTRNFYLVNFLQFETSSDFFQTLCLQIRSAACSGIIIEIKMTLSLSYRELRIITTSSYALELHGGRRGKARGDDGETTFHVDASFVFQLLLHGR